MTAQTLPPLPAADAERRTLLQATATAGAVAAAAAAVPFATSFAPSERARAQGGDCHAPANWQPTPVEAIAPTYIARNTPKGKLDSFRFRAGR